MRRCFGAIMALIFSGMPGTTAFAQSAGELDGLYRRPQGVESRWVSFENLSGEKGAAARENQGAKGHAYDTLAAGETKTLLDIAGPGTVRRIWMTLSPRTAVLMRTLRLDMTWDGAERPAVSVPLGDFFCWILGKPATMENALFANPEGRSLLCYIPMPFRNHARITLTNESETPVDHLFYDIDLTLGDAHGEDMQYFHACWRRERPTTLGEDFAILPEVQGDGRFLGCHVGVMVNAQNKGWWGEGEVKIYVEDDSALPTMAGTGTEDYIGTAWGQGEFTQRYQGCTLSDNKAGRFSFYRYHVPDPVYFHGRCRVTIQQIGGAPRNDVAAMVKAGVPIRPISLDNATGFRRLLDETPVPDVTDPAFPEGWVNFYRQDDFCATAFFYLAAPASNLPPLAPVSERVAEIK